MVEVNFKGLDFGRPMAKNIFVKNNLSRCSEKVYVFTTPSQQLLLNLNDINA